MYIFHNLKKLYRTSTSKSDTESLRSYYYQQLLEKCNNNDFNLELHKELESKNSICINDDILHNHKMKFGCSIHDVKRKFGLKAHYSVSSKINPTIDILLYRLMIGGQKVKCELHFFENSLFIFNYTFSYLSSKSKEIISNLIFDKYLQRSFDFANQKITDGAGNTINVNDGNTFEINYVASGDVFFKEALYLFNKKRMELMDRENRKIKQLYDML